MLGKVDEQSQAVIETAINVWLRDLEAGGSLAMLAFSSAAAK